MGSCTEKLGLLVGNDFTNDFAVQIWFKNRRTIKMRLFNYCSDVMNPDSSGIAKFLKRKCWQFS